MMATRDALTPERWRQVKQVLAAALELETPERAAFIEKNCGDDEALRNEVTRLLRADAQAGTQFLNQPLFLDEAAGISSERAYWSGRRIGAYRVGESIGLGGMGEVYRGVRDDDQYRTDVAIKFVRAAPGSAFVDRFRIERQILADLNHPNISRLLDGGTTEEGVPYGVPKLLDFGVAKLLHEGSEPSEQDLTRTGGRFLTPEYASPEQVRGEPVTTATDVYSLGVILYELVAQRPTEANGLSALTPSWPPPIPVESAVDVLSEPSRHRLRVSG